jgi:hypothetical protein
VPKKEEMLVRNSIVGLVLMASTAAWATGAGAAASIPFKKFAYEGCMAEGKYGRSVCACNADNLDKTLTEEEKNNYKKAALGDMTATLELLKITNKLMDAILKCAS